MPDRTIMDIARKCVDMTRLDRVWRAWEMTQTEIYALSLINYHLDGEGEVFIDDNGAVEVETADEHAVFYMELQDSLNNGGEMVLHVDWLKEFSEKGFQLYVQGLDAAGEMRVFYQKHYKNPEDAVYLSIADSFTNISVGIQGNVHFRIDNIRYTGGSWVNEEVLVRVCDDGGDRYRFGFNGMLKDNEWAGMGTHLDFGARIYDSRVGRWLSVDPLAEQAPNWTPYRYGFNNPIRYYDQDGRWEWDANGNLVAQKGDQSYSLAKFLGTSQKNAMTILGRSGVTANDKGILNLKEGQVLSKISLWVGFKSASGPVVNNTKEAINHYFNGKGAAADVGDQSTRELLSSSKFQEKHNKITSQVVEPEGYFSVDLTKETFHIGRTGVDYSVSSNGTSSAVKYTLFTNPTFGSDGFWDPDFIDEKVIGDWFNLDKFKPDGPGPYLVRLGGTS